MLRTAALLLQKQTHGVYATLPLQGQPSMARVGFLSVFTPMSRLIIL